MTTQEILAEMKEGLVCLVPRDGVVANMNFLPITSHEYTLCDCKVLRLVAALEKCIEQRDLYIWTETETEAIAKEELELANKAITKILTGNEEVKE